MKVGIIGAGNIGAALAELLAGLGHEVAISNSRGPRSLARLVDELGPGAHAATVEDAARFGDIAIEAIPFGAYRDLPAAALSGKVLISASNYFPMRDGALSLGERAQTELIAEYLPDTRVVKAFNSISRMHLREQGDPTAPMESRRAVFLAGDHEEAKQTVASLIEDLGFGPVDVGSLRASKIQEPGTYFFNRDLTAGEARQWLRSNRE